MDILTGDEHFLYNGVPINRLLNDFWAWQSSDLLDVYTRGAMAEYIVATALGIDSDARSNWQDHDLEYKSLKIEVKSSTNILIDNSNNSPAIMKTDSGIRFNIAPNRRTHSVIDADWNETDSYRHSDIYIFCLLRFEDLSDTDPMQLERWRFYVIRTSDINSLLGNQRSITLSSMSHLPVSKCNFEELQETVDRLTSEASQ